MTPLPETAGTVETTPPAEPPAGDTPEEGDVYYLTLGAPELLQQQQVITDLLATDERLTPEQHVALSGVSELLHDLARQAFVRHGITGIVVEADYVALLGESINNDPTIATAALQRVLDIERQRGAADPSVAPSMLQKLISIVGIGPARQLLQELRNTPPATT